MSAQSLLPSLRTVDGLVLVARTLKEFMTIFTALILCLFRADLPTESLLASDTSIVGWSCMTIMSMCLTDPMVPLDFEVETWYVVDGSGNVAYGQMSSGFSEYAKIFD